MGSGTSSAALPVISPDYTIKIFLDLAAEYANTGIVETEKPLYWMASTLKDLRGFPDDVQDVIGYALQLAQEGHKHPDAKPLKGFGSASVLEVVENFDGDTYRAVYTVKFEGVVYVLHAFQKKAKRGIKTPKHDIDLIKSRLADAKADYAQRKREKLK